MRSTWKTNILIGCAFVTRVLTTPVAVADGEIRTWSISPEAGSPNDTSLDIIVGGSDDGFGNDTDLDNLTEYNTSIATTPTNTSLGQNNLIRFQRSMYKFVGRTMPEMDLSPDATSLADEIREIKLFFESAGVGRHELMGGVSPLFHNGVRSQFGATSTSSPWSVGNLIDTLSYMESYFRVHPTTLGMHMTVSMNDGRRAYLKVERSPNRHFNEQFDTRGSVTAASDRLDIWFYTDEVIVDMNYDNMLRKFRDMIDSNPPTSRPPSHRSLALAHRGFQIAFHTPPPSVRSTTLTWRQLSDAMSFISTLVSDRVHQKSVFQARLYDKNGLLRVRIDIAIEVNNESTVTSVA